MPKACLLEEGIEKVVGVETLNRGPALRRPFALGKSKDAVSDRCQETSLNDATSSRALDQKGAMGCLLLQMVCRQPGV